VESFSLQVSALSLWLSTLVARPSTDSALSFQPSTLDSVLRTLPMLFFHDPLSGRTVSYGDLLADLRRPGQFRPLVVRSDDAITVFRAVLQALLADGEVTLLGTDAPATAPEKDPAPVPFAAENGPRSHRELLERIRGTAQARLVLSTSGTTGRPRQVAQGIDSLARGVRFNESSAEAVWGLAYHPAHMAGLQVFFQALWNQQGMVRLYGMDPAAIENELAQGEITHLSASPSFYRLLLPLRTPCPSVRQITLGGERCETRLLESLRTSFPSARIRNVYASTEVGSVLVSEGEVFTVKGTLKAMVRVESDELQFHRQLLGEFKEDHEGGEWYGTGDVVEVLSEDPLRFRFVGRRDESINVGGYKVNPEEVASVARSFPGVREVRIYGQSNSVLGEIVACQVLPRDSHFDLAALRRYLAEQLASYKLPRSVEVVDQLPCTPTGKIKRL